VVGQQQNIRPVTDGVGEGRWHRERLVLKIEVLWDVAPCSVSKYLQMFQKNHSAYRKADRLFLIITNKYTIIS
jgi:hypothetical protein